MEEFDIAIIGGGPAGIMAAIAASADLNIVLLEKKLIFGQQTSYYWRGQMQYN